MIAAPRKTTRVTGTGDHDPRTPPFSSMKNRLRPPLFPQAICAIVLLAGCGRSSVPTEADAKAALTVELVSPTTASWPEEIEANGRIVAWQESTVGAEVGDLKLEAVLVNVGDVVTKGQLLAQLDTAATAADLAQVEALVSQMEASAALARDKAMRARQLADAGSISPGDMLQYATDEKTGDAQLASARARLQIQRLKLLHTEVRAPDDGVISSRSATVGAVTNLGAELFRLIRQQRLEWHAWVPADQLFRIAPGQRVRLRVNGQLSLAGFVRQASPVVDPGTLNGMVYVELPEPASLRAGMFVSGDLLFPATPALHVPESALVFRDGFHYVMKVDGSNRVHQTKVSTGRRLGQSVEITGGSLAADDRIVRSGGSFLNEGDTVRVAATAATIASAAVSLTVKGDSR